MTTNAAITDTPNSLESRLTGGWQVRPIPLNSTSPPKADGDWIGVPDSAHLQPVLYPDRPYWGDHLRKINEQTWLYQRTFSVPDFAYRRARLRFEGVDYFASVWLNDRLVGKHEGSFIPFELDVTQALKPGENVLVVQVSSPWDKLNPKGNYPTDHVIRGLIKGQYEHGEGVIPPDVNPIGIWRPVSLVLDQGVSLDHIRIRTALDGKIDLRITCVNATGEVLDGTLKLKIAAENHTGTGVQAEFPLQLAPGTQATDYMVQVPEPRLWWAWDHGDPNLYRLEASIQDSSGAVESQRQEIFGVRTVRLDRTPGRFTYMLNNRPIFIRGSSYMPGLYLSQCSTEGMVRDVELVKQANLNLLRVHVHVSPPELYAVCDRAGMLIWQDFELNWTQDYSPEFEARARILQREMIDLLGNHPSIITWTCHNEPTMIFTRRHNLEQHPDPALYADALEQDSTRPVFICSGQQEGDWKRSGDIHSYYGGLWTERYTDIYMHEFRLNTEFGMDAPAALETLRKYPDLWERLRHLEYSIDELWDYQAALIQYQVEHLRRLRDLCSAGYIHFWFTDLVPQVGCGVLDADRHPKGGYEALRRASQPLHIALENIGSHLIALWVFNDTMQAYEEVMVRWRILDGKGNTLLDGEYNHFDLRANASQRVMRINWPIRREKWTRIELTLSDADGKLLAENHYPYPFHPYTRPRGYPWKFDRYLGTKVFDRPDAPSLADGGVAPFFKIVPLKVRETVAEWALRQQLPNRFTSAVARILDRVMT